MVREKSKRQAEYSRKWYLKHQQEQIDRVMPFNRKYKSAARAFVDEYKKGHPCVDCGEVDPIVLDFDHITDNKKMCIARLVGGGFSLQLIKEEIGKCEVRCSNCHRRITHYRREAKKLLRET